jgi:hypothetical protein
MSPDLRSANQNAAVPLTFDVAESGQQWRREDARAVNRPANPTESTLAAKPAQGLSRATAHNAKAR